MTALWIVLAALAGLVLGVVAVPAYFIVQQLRGKGINW